MEAEVKGRIMLLQCATVHKYRTQEQTYRYTDSHTKSCNAALKCSEVISHGVIFILNNKNMAFSSPSGFDTDHELSSEVFAIRGSGTHNKYLLWFGLYLQQQVCFGDSSRLAFIMSQ